MGHNSWSSTAAQQYPAKPVRFVVPFAVGGPNDLQARMLGEKLAQRLGQPFLIENRGGANGNIGMELVAKSPPDGYTIVIATVGTWAVSPSLYKLSFDMVRDFAPIILVSTSPAVLVLHPSVPAGSVRELMAPTVPVHFMAGGANCGQRDSRSIRSSGYTCRRV